ncbi:FAD-dependent oxidoreductase [Terricaulis sp.]|uniref:FAD-dependent oxidoreductase n=1 Tax=Terricaulis sp. TaxID=2768686 RepID=UPI0037834125
MIRSIAIAGCGVAGLATATLLKRQGAEVVVFDKLQKPSPLGSGLILQPVGLYVLDQLGVGARVRALGARIERLYGRTAPAQRVVLDVRYRALGEGKPCGVGIHRGALFEVLYGAAQSAGVVIEAGREVRGAGDGRLVFADRGQSPRFDLVVDALGMRSPLSAPQPTPLTFGALWANLDWCGDFDPHALEQRYEQARKMTGVLPIGRLRDDARQQAAFFWSLKGADEAAWRAQPIETWKDEVQRLWPATAPLLAQIASHDDLVFARYAHRTRAPVTRDLDALALAAALDARADLRDALEDYARTRSTHIGLYQLASLLFTPAYQSDSAAIAWLRDWLMSPLSRVPPAPRILAALVAGQIGSPLARIG